MFSPKHLPTTKKFEVYSLSYLKSAMALVNNASKRYVILGWIIDFSECSLVNYIPLAPVGDFLRFLRIDVVAKF